MFRKLSSKKGIGEFALFICFIVFGVGVGEIGTRTGFLKPVDRSGISVENTSSGQAAKHWRP